MFGTILLILQAMECRLSFGPGWWTVDVFLRNCRREMFKSFTQIEGLVVTTLVLQAPKMQVERGRNPPFSLFAGRKYRPLRM